MALSGEVFQKLRANLVSSHSFGLIFASQGSAGSSSDFSFASMLEKSGILEMINSQLVDSENKRGAKMKILIDSNQHGGVRRFAGLHH
jgi:hypothetical protein